MFKKACCVCGLLFVCLVGCGPSQEEKLTMALKEVERLDEMRKKTMEIIAEQVVAIAAEREKNDDWVMLESENLYYKKREFEKAEKKREEVGNWHIAEEKRIRKKHLSSWNWKIDDKKRVIRTLERDSIRYEEKLRKASLSAYKAHVTKLLKTATDSVAKERVELERLKRYSKLLGNTLWKSIEKPKKRVKEIAHWEKVLFDAKTVYLREEAVWDSLVAAKTRNLDKMRADLVLSRSTYDSINAMHTRAVTVLSKFERPPSP